jgi:hypothetical protein
LASLPYNARKSIGVPPKNGTIAESPFYFDVVAGMCFAQSFGEVTNHSNAGTKIPSPHGRSLPAHWSVRMA